MKHRHAYRISDLTAYINWAYFYHAWGIPVQETSEAERLMKDARRMLARLTNYTSVNAVVDIQSCYADGDDIVLLTQKPVRLPMLRQQHPDSEGFCLCLADFIRPKDSITDTIGVFATTVSSPQQYDDNYSSLLAQTLCDRLAEAAAERLHEEVRKTLWGYAPDETLTMDELHAEKFQGIRPAVGYPSLPDLSLNFLLDSVLNFQEIGITLTEHGMMQPHASVSGLMLSHPAAHYFSVGTISEEQLRDYAQRRELSVEVMRTYLSANLSSKS